MTCSAGSAGAVVTWSTADEYGGGTARLARAQSLMHPLAQGADAGLPWMATELDELAAEAVDDPEVAGLVEFAWAALESRRALDYGSDSAVQRHERDDGTHAVSRSGRSRTRTRSPGFAGYR
jgi:hypothetical protein